MIMKETVLDIIKEILKAKGLDVEILVNEDTKLREDLSLNSFDLAELTVKIEDKFGVDIFEDGLVKTVGEIFAKLEK